VNCDPFITSILRQARTLKHVTIHWLAFAALSGPWLALGTLTAAGSRRRGRTRRLALLEGLFFPVAWAIWYMIDVQLDRQREPGCHRIR